jgi:hypothetical protein
MWRTCHCQTCSRVHLTGVTSDAKVKEHLDLQFQSRFRFSRSGLGELAFFMLPGHTAVILLARTRRTASARKAKK